MKKSTLLSGAILFTLFSASGAFAFGERHKKTKLGLGGKDVRIPLEWIIDTAKKQCGFVYGPGDYGRELQFGRCTPFL